MFEKGGIFMKLNKTIAAAAVLALSVAASGGAANASTNLISDGDFSNPDQGGGWNIYSPGINGWTNVNGDGIEIGNSGVYGLACENAGCQNLEVNANTFDSDEQVVTGLTVGAYYNLSYLYGARNSGGPDIMNAYFGDAPPSLASFLTTNTNPLVGNSGPNSWTANSFVVKADATTETLYFQSVDTNGLPSYGNEITNVSLTAVPEPATWAMFLAGFGGIGFMLRNARRKNAAATA
jgi:hypothetical protein